MQRLPQYLSRIYSYMQTMRVTNRLHIRTIIRYYKYAKLCRVPFQSENQLGSFSPVSFKVETLREASMLILAQVLRILVKTGSGTLNVRRVEDICQSTLRFTSYDLLSRILGQDVHRRQREVRWRRMEKDGSCHRSYARVDHMYLLRLTIMKRCLHLFAEKANDEIIAKLYRKFFAFDIYIVIVVINCNN